MSAQYHSTSQDGVKTYTNRDGDTVQESSGPVPIFRGLAAAGGEAFISESEEDSSEEEYHHHQHAGVYQIPQQAPEKKKSKKDKKDKKDKKSKKERSGSSSSGHACTCSHSH